jgi:nitrate/nitrite transport system substrate-binding protein
VPQLRRWGCDSGAPDYEAIAKQVMRPDLYEEAMKELGVKHGGPNEEVEKLFDGSVFDPKADGETYARSFAVHSIKG